MAKWAEAADAEEKAVKAAAIVAAAAPEAKQPELPPNLKRCLSQTKQVWTKQKQKQPQQAKADKKAAKVAEVAAAKVVEGQGKSSSADALVLARLEQARKRDACARLLLQWYEREVKPQKVAAVKK